MTLQSLLVPAGSAVAGAVLQYLLAARALPALKSAVNKFATKVAEKTK